MAKSDKEPSTKPVALFASTDCPKCGGFVPLAGQGSRGEQVRLEGYCPNRHLVFVLHTVPD
jgi:hypothetical protein